MSTDNDVLEVSGVSVQVVRKKIKNLHLSVCPPDGKVRIAAPIKTSSENVRLAVISRLSWIKKKQAEFQQQPRQSQRRFVDGESHYFLGRRFVLKVIESAGPSGVETKNNSKLLLRVRPCASLEKRSEILSEWYRAYLKKTVPALLEKWQPIVGKEVTDWRIQKMKTKWGSCNIPERRIILNLELAKKSPECLEYILVHELVHLHERHHNDQFRALMDKFLPKWRVGRDMLKSEPLAHEKWEY